MHFAERRVPPTLALLRAKQNEIIPALRR